MTDFDTLKKKTVAIVRTFNNPEVASQVDRLLELGIRRVIVIINANRDDRKTLDYLGKDRLNDPRLSVHEMDDYGWSKGLNRGLFLADRENKSSETSEVTTDYILNISVEAQINKDKLEQMLDTLISETKLGVVGTTFQGLQEDDNGTLRSVELGPPYNLFARNTCALYKFDTLKETWGFDPVVDENRRGMEDYLFLLQLRTHTDWQWKLLDLKVPLVVGRHFDQTTKEQESREVMKWIEKEMEMRATRDPELLKRFTEARNEMHRIFNPGAGNNPGLRT